MSSSADFDKMAEQELRSAVVKFYQTNDLDSLTLKRVRGVASAKLGLEDNFFKTDPQWKDRSKDVVNAEVARQESKRDEPTTNCGSRPESERHESHDAVHNELGPSEESPGSKVEQNGQDREKLSPQANGQVSESELSSVLDEPPAPKRRRKQAVAASTSDKGAKPAKTKKNKADSTAVSPQEDEIKRLQGWLVKCGTRKLWHKQLAPFRSPREKISHLKSMLVDAGMVGRYSEEKARTIKEARELKADLEAVQEGNQKWGKDGEEENDDAVDGSGRPHRRRLAKGLQELAVFDDDSNEGD